MTGMEQYSEFYRNRIQNVIDTYPILNDFYAYLALNKSEVTIYNYLIMIRKFLQTARKDPANLTYLDFLSFMQHERYNRDGTEKTNSGAICTYHALKNYSTFLYNSGQLSDNPMLKVNRPKTNESQKTIAKREKGYLTSQEIQQILQRLQEESEYVKAHNIQNRPVERDKAIIILFLTTGIRASALSRIDVKDLDFNTNELRLTEKGGKVRTYNLSPLAINCIKQWLEKRRIMMSGIDEEALFINRFYERLSYEAIAAVVERYASVIKGKRITPHKLRATYGTQLYEATKDIYFVQRAMGHSSPTTTERYIRGQANVTKEASDIMDNILNGGNEDN